MAYIEHWARIEIALSATGTVNIAAAETLERTLVGMETLGRGYLESYIVVRADSHSFPDLVGSPQLQAKVQMWGFASSIYVVA